jgi:hypothetical protein
MLVDISNKHYLSDSMVLLPGLRKRLLTLRVVTLNKGVTLPSLFATHLSFPQNSTIRSYPTFIGTLLFSATGELQGHQA